MYKKLLACIISILPVSCLADDGYYLSFQTGISSNKSEVDRKLFGSSAALTNNTNTNITYFGLGKRINDNFRVGIDFGYDSLQILNPHYIKKTNLVAESENININMSSINFMTNLYYDFKPIAQITPYVNIGIGIAKNSAFYNGNLASYDATNPENIDQNGDIVPFAGYLGSSKYSFTNMMLQLGLGFNYAISENVSIDFTYKHVRYLGNKKLKPIQYLQAYSRLTNIDGLLDAKIPGKDDDSVSIKNRSSNQFLVGVRVNLK